MAKLSANAIEGFVRNPDPKYQIVLLYGEDRGLARERMKAICGTVVDDLNDPFNVADLPADRITETPSLLAEEAAAISMMGGRRVVLIRDAGNAVAPMIADFLSSPIGDALIVMIAGPLAPGAKLRQVVEKSDIGVALPCYLDSEAAIAGLIDQVFRADGISIDPDARAYLVDHLGQDRGSSRGEIEKLALYAGANGRLALEDVRAAIGDSAAPAIDDVVQNAFAGNPRDLDHALTQLFALGGSAIPILRSGANHCLRLRQAQAAVSGGKDIKSAMKSLRPPVFFKLENAFAEQMRLWRGSVLVEALDHLQNAEADCKKTGAAEPLICGRAYHRIAVMAARAATQRSRR